MVSLTSSAEPVSFLRPLCCIDQYGIKPPVKTENACDIISASVFPSTNNFIFLCALTVSSDVNRSF